jgi:Lipocalin-like domain
MMKRYALSIGFFLVSASAAFAQTKSPIEGVWKITEIVWPDRDSAISHGFPPGTNPQPGLMIFTRGYFSTVMVQTGQQRRAAAPAKDPQHLTDAEKIARFEEWRPFAASSGAYEIKGSTLIRRPMVAKVVSNMNREMPGIWEFNLEVPNTLWLIPTGDLVVTEPRMKLTRLE